MNVEFNRHNTNSLKEKPSLIEQEISRLEDDYEKNPFPLKEGMRRHYRQGMNIIQTIGDIIQNSNPLNKYRDMSCIYFSSSVPKFLSEAKTIMEAYKH